MALQQLSTHVLALSKKLQCYLGIYINVRYKSYFPLSALEKVKYLVHPQQ